MYLIFFIHSAVNGHMICYHFLDIMKSFVINMGVQRSLQQLDCTFFGYIPSNGIAESYVVLFLPFWVVLFLAFWQISYSFSIMDILSYFATNAMQGFCFSRSSSVFVADCLFYNNLTVVRWYILFLVCIFLMIVILRDFLCTC